MADNIIHKKSSVAAKVPLAGDLAYGELAVNYQDGIIYAKKVDNSIVGFLDSSKLIKAADFTAKGQLLVASNSGTYSHLSIGTNNYALIADSAQALGMRWAAITSGTVTSVDATQPAAGFTISGSPITSSGTLTFVLANDLAALEALSSTGIAVRTASDTWAQRTVTGTTNRVTVTNGSGASGDPTIDIAATYVGQTSITTLGTVATGTWNATSIGISKGGTGQTSALAAFNALSPLTTKGDLISNTGSANVRVPVGTDSQVLMADSSQSSGLKWVDSNFSLRNKLINGNFDYWHRATSQTTAAYGSVDRWFNSHTGSTKTTSRQSFTVGQTDVPNNPKYWIRTAVSSVAGAGNYCFLLQKIEDVTQLSGKTVTLSFWAKADVNRNIAVEFSQSFGAGGSPSATVTGIGVTTFALTTSWQKFTTTVTIPSISGKTLGTDGNDQTSVLFWFDAGSTYNSRTNSLGQQSGTFDIAQVQLEEGSIATPFEVRPQQIELALCQRYFYAFRGFNCYWYQIAGGAYLQTLTFPVQMRAVPSVTAVGSQSLSNCTQSGSNGSPMSFTTFYLYFITTTTGSAQGAANSTVGFNYNAEL